MWAPKYSHPNPDEHEQGESNPTGIRAGEWGKNSNAIEQKRPRILQNQTENLITTKKLQIRSEFKP